MKPRNSRVIVVGASGLVGAALLAEFKPYYETTGTFCKHGTSDLVHLDLRDQDEVRSILHQLRPNLVLCSAAQPNVELCEIDPEGTRQVNVNGLRNLLAVTAEIGAPLVYFSSEYVFDGTNGPYSENDLSNPLNEYGRQKLECERMIPAQLDRYIIGRVSGVYNWESSGKNFVARFIDSLLSGRNFEVPFDQVITPTYAPNLARSVRQLVEKGRWGLFHLSGSQSMPRIEFAYLIANVFGLNQSLIIPTASSKLKLHAARPVSAGLKNDKAQALLDCTLLSPREGLEMMKASREHSSRLPRQQANM